MSYSFYVRKGENRKTGRVLPFSHNYGANIALHTKPDGRVFVSYPPSSVEGIPESELTLMNVFGTSNPKIELRSLLVFKRTGDDVDSITDIDILGLRFYSESSFIIDIDADFIESDLRSKFIGSVPLEYLVQKGDMFYTEFELQTGIKVVSVGESNEILNYIKSYMRGV